MKKVLIIGAIVLVFLALIGGGIYAAVGGSIGSGFSVQTTRDRGNEVRWLMSGEAYGTTALIEVPARDTNKTTDKGAWTVDNPDGQICFLLDKVTKLPVQQFDCGTGVQIPDGTLFSIAGKANGGFKLHQP